MASADQNFLFVTFVCSVVSNKVRFGEGTETSTRVRVCSPRSVISASSVVSPSAFPIRVHSWLRKTWDERPNLY